MLADSAGPFGSQGWPGIALPSTIGEFARHARLARRDLLLHGGVGREQPCHRHALQFAHLPRLQSQFREQQIRVLHRVLVRRQTKHGSALDDRAMEQPFRARHRHQRRDFSAASGLTEDRDEIRIAAESVDVVAHPLERGDDVEQADAARQREVGTHRVAEIRVAEHVQPMIRCHDHDVVRVREAGAVENASGAGAARKSAAVQPHHHRPLASVVQTRREDIQHETVFALLSGRSGGGRAGVVAGLRRGGAECERVARTGPRGGLDAAA